MIFGIDIIPPWVKPALLALALAGAFGAGTYVEGLRWSKDKASWTLAQQKATIDAQKKNLTSISKALKTDSAQAILDAQTSEELERIGNEIAATASDKPALSSDSVDRLRKLWK